MKKIIAISVCVLIIACCLTGCGYFESNEVQTSETTTTTTTTTTTVRTTEDLETTFEEQYTNKIYDALKTDEDGTYEYKLASYTTYYSESNTSRATNIKNAVAKLNNLKIPAGKTFSFNQVVGKRTVVAGYEEAHVIENNQFVDGLGGGICQVSSTVFQAALRSNMEITVRKNHSLAVNYVDLGGDATVDWNSQDFQFVNNSGSDIRLTVTAKGGALTCTVWAKDDIDIGEVKIKIKEKDGVYTLTRTVDGVKNYTTKSKYSTPDDEDD